MCELRQRFFKQYKLYIKNQLENFSYCAAVKAALELPLSRAGIHLSDSPLSSVQPTIMSESPSEQPPISTQTPRVRKPPFADWPTIKILIPPQGEYSLVAELIMYS